MLISTQKFKEIIKSKIINLFPFKFIKRKSLYYLLRLTRLEASIYSVSAGFACGSMVSFTPFLGLHFLLAIFIAFIIRGNLIASLIGTIVGNPFTFPLIWLSIYRIGSIFTPEVSSNKNINFNFENMLNNSFDILLPMLIGSAIVCIPVWFTSFYLIRFLILTFKKNK